MSRLVYLIIVVLLLCFLVGCTVVEDNEMLGTNKLFDGDYFLDKAQNYAWAGPTTALATIAQAIYMREIRDELRLIRIALEGEGE